MDFMHRPAPVKTGPTQQQQRQPLTAGAPRTELFQAGSIQGHSQRQQQQRATAAAVITRGHRTPDDGLTPLPHERTELPSSRRADLAGPGQAGWLQQQQA